jgi:hypothetical protein
MSEPRLSGEAPIPGFGQYASLVRLPLGNEPGVQTDEEDESIPQEDRTCRRSPSS